MKDKDLESLFTGLILLLRYLAFIGFLLGVLWFGFQDLIPLAFISLGFALLIWPDY